MNIREGIQAFLNARESESPYLIPKWNTNLESQFLCHEGNQEHEGGWTDGSEVWAHHRWPYNAGTDPNYRDKALTFSPGAHIKRIGSTWWNFRDRRSVAVALDIDLEEGHAESTTTVTREKLNDLIERLSNLDYITLVRSSGGGGVHIYSFFDPEHQPISVNHNEHTQVAHALVAKISEDLTYNLKQHMDAIGVVFWLWSCDSPENHPGYKLIKEQTAYLKAADLEGYFDTNMMSSNRNIKVVGYNDKGERVESTAEGGGYKVYALEPEHIDFLKELEDEGFSYIWESKFNMAHTHTAAIKAVFDRRAESGNPMKGMFETLSRGTDKSKPNCYITPRPGGVFQVKRFGTATAEHPLWDTIDDDTWCFLNQETPVLRVLKKFSCSWDGIKMVFTSDALIKAVKALGQELPESTKGISTPINVNIRKDGTIRASFKGSGAYEGWLHSGDSFSLTLPVIHKPADYNKSMLEEADSFVRHVVTPDFEPYGWALKAQEFWVIYNNYDAVNCVVTDRFGKDAGRVRAEMTSNPWVLHHKPFGQEYPGGRLWNKNAPQLAIDPSTEPGPHPHWDMIMTHLGSTLDDTVAGTDWCQQWGIQSGADYLRYWISALIQDPMEPLPYLFFYGPQDSGKSIFHESIDLLFTCGVTSVATALCSGAGYNAEIANAVLGHVEEKDLSSVETAYTRIKDWIMAKTMTIHKKGHTPYNQPNTLHMVQMANRPNACPMEDGDTRITAVLVPALKKVVPKKAMMIALEKEAPFFLRTILTIYLPESHTRLRVPMLATEHKKDLESMNQTPFESFCEEFLIPMKGQSVSVSDFYTKYSEWCTAKNVETPKQRTILQMIRNRGDRFVVGIGTGKQNHIANFTLDKKSKPKVEYVLNDKGRLVRANV